MLAALRCRDYATLLQHSSAHAAKYLSSFTHNGTATCFWALCLCLKASKGRHLLVCGSFLFRSSTADAAGGLQVLHYRDHHRGPHHRTHHRRPGLAALLFEARLSLQRASSKATAAWPQDCISNAALSKANVDEHLACVVCLEQHSCLLVLEALCLCCLDHQALLGLLLSNCSASRSIC